MDRISSLPDEVLCHILSFLTTKQAVATSVLSSRWVYLWLSVPVIDLDDSLYLNPERKDPNSELFMNFFERVSSLNESETILKFRLRLHCHVDETIEPLSEINGFIQNVFLRNVVEIDFKIYSYFSENEDEEYDDWVNIPHSKSLEVLKVSTDITLKMPAFPGCFPSLRVFDVRLALDTDDELLTDLFPCLPALEKLCVDARLNSCVGEFSFNIGGAALKHLELNFFITDFAECEAVVVIDAPKLEYLKLRDTFLALYVVKHEPAISEVRLHVQDDHDFSEFSDFLEGVIPTHLSRFIELLQGLVNTKFISISASTLEVIFSQYWNIPLLPSLTKLELYVPASSWILLLHLLERCPNLKALSLIIKKGYHEESEEEEWMVPDVVPSCLSSCIKEIEIKRLGKADEEEMIKYLLDNAKVLDKFTVDSRV